MYYNLETTPQPRLGALATRLRQARLQTEQMESIEAQIKRNSCGFCGDPNHTWPVVELDPYWASEMKDKM